MDKLKRTFFIDKLDQWIYYVLLVLALASCLSEPLSRNAARVALSLALLRLLIEPAVLQRLRPYRGFLFAMGSLIGVLTVSAIYGGKFYDTVTGSTFWYNYNMLLFFVGAGCIRTKQRVYNIFGAMVVSLLLVDLYIFWQSWHGIVRPMSFVKGTFMLTAMFYAILLPVLCVFFMKTQGKMRVGYGILILLSLIAVFLSGTRGLWLALGPTLLGMLFYYRIQMKCVVIIFCILAGTLIGMSCFLPSFEGRVSSVWDMQEQSHSERLLMWQSAVTMAVDHPLLGVGMGNYQEAYQDKYISPLAKEKYQRHAHSNFFHFLGEDGIIGLGVYCGVFSYFLYWFWRRRHNIFAMAMLLSTITLLLYSLTDYTYAGYAGMRLYWLILGLSATGAYHEYE